MKKGLCNDCNSIKENWSGKEEETCHCGGQLCSCPACSAIIEDIEELGLVEAVRKNAHLYQADYVASLTQGTETRQ